MSSKSLTNIFISLLCLFFSVVVHAEISSPLPDTGQTKFYNNTVEISAPAPGQAFYGQDAHYTGERSYTKLKRDGSEWHTGDPQWVMVRDNVTGLIWEVKEDQDDTQNYNNPQDADNTYTWYDSNSATNGGNSGTPGTAGTNTEDYINDINAANYGGHNDWRLPTDKELSSLVNAGRYNPAINTDYFPDVLSSRYWSSTVSVFSANIVWIVNFKYGDNNGGSKMSSYYVRAVRSGQSGSFVPLVIHENSLADANDDTVSDPNTGLMWQRFDAGAKSWNAGLTYCENSTLAGYDDWRLPNLNELQSLVDHSKSNPALSELVDGTAVFTGLNLSFGYWSSTTYVGSTNDAWLVNFSAGSGYGFHKTSYKYIRAVRSEQSGLLGPNDIDNDSDGYTENQGDCNDGDATVYPGAVEICGDGVDQDCNGNDLACPVDYISGSYNYYLPYFRSGAGYWSGVGVSNSSKVNTSPLSITVYGRDGSILATEYPNPLPINGQTSQAVASALEATGWIMINSHEALTGLSFFGRSYMADVPFVDTVSKSLMIPHIAQNEMWDTHLLICNPNNTPVTLTLTAYDQGGNEVATNSSSLPALASDTYPLADTFSSLPTLTGKVKVTVTQGYGVVAFALYMNQKSSGSYFAGINAVDISAPVVVTPF